MKPSTLLSLAFKLIVTSAHLLPRATISSECSDPVPNTCSFYSNCLEQHLHCGPSGYPIGYGLKYCSKFTAARSQMSAAGKTWVTNTMLCLQRDLVMYGDGRQTTTCSALDNYAFGTHPDCYVKSGLCTLPPTDWWTITIQLASLHFSIGSILLRLFLKPQLDALNFIFGLSAMELWMLLSSDLVGWP